MGKWMEVVFDDVPRLGREVECKGFLNPAEEMKEEGTFWFDFSKWINFGWNQYFNKEVPPVGWLKKYCSDRGIMVRAF